MSLSTESQLTLVNPEPPLELVFEKATVLNTRLLLNSRPRYQIATVDRDAFRTEVKDLKTNEVVAVIQRRHLRSDVVRFPERYEGKSMKLSQWMVEGKTEDEHDIWTMRNDHGVFFWKMDPTYRLALYSENAPEEPIAYVKTEPFTLIVKQIAEVFLDEIIPSFVLLEQMLRLQVKVYRKAEGMVMSGRMVAGHLVQGVNVK